MSLAPGTRLGAYEILTVLGAGGMGEVYRARDTRLGREVAIKVIPAAFSADIDRLQRFEQEARAAATLNHPNILAVHDVGTHDGSPFIVSELLEGETLRERLSAGPLPVRKAIELGIQIAHALAAAHEKGIVHRDLKPENIFINKDGRAKVLDFGLAKLTRSDSPLVAGTNVPTTPAGNLTQAGVMLGTIGYMAPEQVRGQAVDHRADIFSLGAILYEMLSGSRAFRGMTSIDTVSAILKEDPPDLPVAERHIPPALCRVIDRCLEKNAAARFGTADDLAFALDALSTQSGAASVAAADLPVGRKFSRERLAWAAMVAVCLLGLATTLPSALARWRDGVPIIRPVRFSIPPPLEGAFAPASALSISPDGTKVAFTGSAKDGQNVIWIRSLDALEATPLPGTEEGFQPFWSPDSRFVGFFADSKLKKVEVTGGPSQTLCAIPPGPANGGTWNKDGIIVFAAARGTGGLQKVGAGGGEPVAVTKLDASTKEAGHLWPSFLPDGRRFLYLSLPSKTTMIGSLESAETTTVLTADTRASYAAPGNLLFVRQGSLMAQPFDHRAGELSGDPFPIAERVAFNPVMGGAQFDASANGVLAYRLGNPFVVQMSSYDRTGRSSEPIGAAADFRDLALSPDGGRLMIHRHDDAAGGGGLWVMDKARGTTSKLTFDASHNVTAYWSPDAKEVAFTSNRDGGIFNIYKKISTGAGSDELLLKSPENKALTDWSPDGRFLVYAAEGPKTALDIWVLPLAGDRKPMPFLRTEAAEGMGRLSPDGRWMAYVSNETGRNEVYVQPFPASGAKWLVSTGGGTQPRWAVDGSSLYYLAAGSAGAMTITTVDVRAIGSVFEAAAPKPLFLAPMAQVQVAGLGLLVSSVTQSYAVSKDGQRFFTLSPVPDAMPPMITVVMNWAEAVGK